MSYQYTLSSEVAHEQVCTITKAELETSQQNTIIFINNAIIINWLYT